MITMSGVTVDGVNYQVHIETIPERNSQYAIVDISPSIKSPNLTDMRAMGQTISAIKQEIWDKLFSPAMRKGLTSIIWDYEISQL